MRIALAFVLAVVLAGCSSTVLVLSEPSGAKVEVDGQFVGTTPCHAEFGGALHPQTKGVVVKASMPGYANAVEVVHRDVPTWTVRVLTLPVIGWFLPIPYPAKTTTFRESVTLTLKPDATAAK